MQFFETDLDKSWPQMKMKVKRSRLLALAAVFASLTVVLDSIPGIPQLSDGVWYSWAFLTEPIIGLVLPPKAAFLSMFLGVMAGHVVFPRHAYEFLFMIGSPIGSFVSALLLRRKYRTVIVFFTVLFMAYFATPVSWQLPWWGMWDTYLAYIGLLASSTRHFGGKSSRKLATAFYALIGLEADILFRIFLFIPCQTYQLLSFTVEELQFIWIAGASVTPIQVAISVAFTSAIGPPLMKIVERMDLRK